MLISLTFHPVPLRARAARFFASVLAVAGSLASAACGSKSSKPAPAAVQADAGGPVIDATAPPDATASPDSGAAAADVDASAPQAASLPAALRDFEAFLSDLEKRPQNAARAKRTCSIATDDKHRTLFFAAFKVAPPPSAPADEWKEAAEDFANTEYDIGNLCQDLDWDDDVEILGTLRKRFDRLVALAGR